MQENVPRTRVVAAVFCGAHKPLTILRGINFCAEIQVPVANVSLGLGLFLSFIAT